MSNVGKAKNLESSEALKGFLSKEVKNFSVAFKDYTPTRSLVRDAIADIMGNLGLEYPNKNIEDFEDLEKIIRK